MRIFFDTNVLFSAFGYRGVCHELFRECTIRHTIVVSEYVIEELLRTLEGKLDLIREELTDIEEQLQENCELAPSHDVLDFPVRDKNDIPILSAAVASKSDILVTGDKDLLEFPNPPIEILTPRQLHTKLFAGR